MKRGKLIVFEGISGTGKETQAKLLQKFLQKKGIIAHIVFHPSPDVKPELRKAKTIERQLAILARDRERVVNDVIRPAIARGGWVISLRSFVSAMVYQGDTGVVKKIDIPADYLLYFDLDPQISLQRILARGEQVGKYETAVLLNDKRKKYQEVLQHIPHITIDASLSIDDIHHKVVKYIS